MESNQLSAIESLLSVRVLLSPRIAGDRVYFVSDLSGRMSIYSMKKTGSLAVPLLPASLALQNPRVMMIYIAWWVTPSLYYVLPKLDKILVMIDKNGDENYQPCFVPLQGGLPEPIFGDKYRGEQVACLHCNLKTNVAYFFRDDRATMNMEALKVDLGTLQTTSLGTSIHGNYFNGANTDDTRVILGDCYSGGDVVLYLWEKGRTGRRLLYGTPIEHRNDQSSRPSGIGACTFVQDDTALLFKSNLFRDQGSITYLPIASPKRIEEVPVKGTLHSGLGELVELTQVSGNRFLIEYNIDGSSWVYEADYHSDRGSSHFRVTKTIVGRPPFSNGVIRGIHFQTLDTTGMSSPDYVFAFAKANVPSQIYFFPHDQERPVMLTEERVLGIREHLLAEGEDASYNSFDGLRISARLYLPPKELQFKRPCPLVLYVHGGPQSQERPDFTWFSMPLIQLLALNGFAVLVPNVRGSGGYGQKFMEWVNHDWGGRDMRDYVEAVRSLERDERVDSSRRGVIGRSYGGYMTLMLASNYPDLWKASCDMWGPYNLMTFLERMPKTWQTYFRLAIGDPAKDSDFLKQRSPVTHIDGFRGPMLIIQGNNDTRVVRQESEDLVNDLRAKGVNVDFLVFEDEGHDVLKFVNKVSCYSRILSFFEKYLMNDSNAFSLSRSSVALAE